MVHEADPGHTTTADGGGTADKRRDPGPLVSASSDPATTTPTGPADGRRPTALEAGGSDATRGARLSSSFADIDKFVERGPTIMSPPGKMPVEDRNFPAAQFRPDFEQVNYKCSQHANRTLK
ncbi:hypothetical protein THAOC_10020 [Thalassiosira oceanica]|uniref:Uncharacterized protein n=1 Tax=Thalassiosira oceanica TaxID=159749 RepID=K0STR0_THAOC|nr:hypothetical protein THAOC_10020 [Thalassiosira oceanica]|eukprot:EJK68770.1 hypothetical protein THAOC_10020 [Thalassiosira oceanica]